MWFRSGFCGLNFLSILSNFLWPEKLTHKKSWAIFQNLNSWMIKLTKTPILPNCQVPNGYFCVTVNFIIQGLKFGKIAHLFFLYQFLEHFRGLRGNLKHKNRVLVDSWWQTETGGIAIAPRPSAQGIIINFKNNLSESFHGIFPQLHEFSKY